MRSACVAGVDALRFWQLTPAELSMEIEAWEKRQEIDNFRVGLLCAVIAEPHRDSKKHKDPFTPQDFMPGLPSDKTRSATQDWQEQLAVVKRLNMAFAGEVIRR